MGRVKNRFLDGVPGPTYMEVMEAEYRAVRYSERARRRRRLTPIGHVVPPRGTHARAAAEFYVASRQLGRVLAAEFRPLVAIFDRIARRLRLG
jgi:hypothetical protein